MSERLDDLLSKPKKPRAKAPSKRPAKQPKQTAAKRERPTLQPYHERQIIRMFAGYLTASEIEGWLREQGVKRIPSISTLREKYDVSSGAEPDKALVDLFWEAREKAQQEISNIPCAHKAQRLKRLQAWVDQAEGRGNVKLAAQLMEQMARDAGDAYSNRRELTGANGGPIRTARDLTDEELEAKLAALAPHFLPELQRLAERDHDEQNASDPEVH